MRVRDPEILELLREEPELLALADALAETQRPPSPSRLGRAVPRVVAAAAAVAAVVAVVLFAPGGGGGPGIVDRALAAIGKGRVLHLVMRVPSGEVLVDLKSGRRTVETLEIEDWSDQSGGGREHLVMRFRGVVADIVFPDDAHGGTSVGKVDPAFAALASGYRQALVSGDAKLERRGIVAGRPVYWLRFAPTKPGRPGTEVAIDRRTYKPMVFRTSSGGRHFDARVLVAETIDFRASDFKRVGASLFGGSGSSGSASVFPANEHLVLRAPWLTAGKRIAGLRLTTVARYDVTTRNRQIKGIQLVYGTRSRHGFAEPRKDSLTIEELAQPDDPNAWKHIPPGSVSIQEGTSSDGHRTQPIWTAKLVVQGVYVTIETGRGERAVLRAARTLHAVP
jgi:hypothetical protein